VTRVSVGPDYIDYWQSDCAVQRGLTSRFGIRVKDGCCSAVSSISGGQSHTFGRLYEIPVQIEIFPAYLRVIIDNHLLNCPRSDLMDVLTGEKCFQDALVARTKREVQSETGKPGRRRLSNAS
jgi:hypothetical protein